MKRPPPPWTWGELKKLINAKVADGDRIFMIDLGPEREPVSIDRDDVGIEIHDYGQEPEYLSLLDRLARKREEMRTAHEKRNALPPRAA